MRKLIVVVLVLTGSRLEGGDFKNVPSAYKSIIAAIEKEVSSGAVSYLCGDDVVNCGAIDDRAQNKSKFRNCVLETLNKNHCVAGLVWGFSFHGEHRARGFAGGGGTFIVFEFSDYRNKKTLDQFTCAEGKFTPDSAEIKLSCEWRF